MTFREKLQLEHPEKVNDKYDGGCYGCPNDYGYETAISQYCASRLCSFCWDREMPEEK